MIRVYVVVATLFALASVCVQAGGEERPNFLMITVDDMNWDSVGVYGSAVENITPNIDRLSEQGLRFTVSDLNAVVGAFQLVNAGDLSMESCTRILGLGKSSDDLAEVGTAAGMIYRGVSY